MVAPTGVNEELPGEPAGAETAEAESARAGEVQAGEIQAEEARPGQAEEEAAPAAVVPAAVVPSQAEPAEEERVPEEDPVDAGPASAEPVEAELAEAELAGGEPAGAELAAGETAGVELAGGEPVEAELADAGLVQEGTVQEGTVQEGTAEAGEADWDAEEHSRDVSPLAVVGIIVGVIALVGVAVGVLAMVTHGFRPKTVVTYRPAAAFGLRPGQCVNSGSDALKVTVVSCARPHDAEVFAAFTLPAAPWPGSSAVRADASNGCASRLNSYIDPQLATASLTQEFVYPNQGAWQAGERTVVCEVSAVNGRLTGSVRANG